MRHREKGQVLLLGILALIVLVLAVFILFDVQNLVRGKIKTQNAVDAAALTGANWQRHTLNLVGELNLVKATTVLIDQDLLKPEGRKAPAFLSVEDREQAEKIKQKERNSQLTTASDLISQIQYRILFLCPLIGVGAAQQAAKNNGLASNDDFGDALLMQSEMISGQDARSYVYEYFRQDDYCSDMMFGFCWYGPYVNLLSALIQQDSSGNATGIAVMPNGEVLGSPTLYTDPQADPDFCSFLQSHSFFDAVQANDWCYVRHFLHLTEKAPQRWWGDLKVRQNTNFLKESELLPVKVRIGPAQSAYYDELKQNGTLENLLSRSDTAKEWEPIGNVYDWTDPVYDSKGKVAVDETHDDKLNPLPAIDWAYYKSDWKEYDSNMKNDWSEYLRSSFKREAAYFSGAICRMDASFTPVTLLSQSTSASPITPFTNLKDADARKYVNRYRTAESVMNDSPPTVYNYSVAKPFGKLKIDGQMEPPCKTELVLPVFSETALIPVALEDPGQNPLADYDWYLFLLEYMPALGEVQKVQNVPASLQEKYYTWHKLVEKMDSEEWRTAGLNWLNTPAAYDEYDQVVSIREDSCQVSRGSQAIKTRKW